jgi:pilus assembly protein Flp/PilA
VTRAAPPRSNYGLIAALISVVIIAAVSLVGTNLQTTFSSVAAAL